jgi:hypothetical protein
MKSKFYGINEIHTTQFTYSETMDENIMYVGVNAQSDTKNKSEDLMLLFSKDQILGMYEALRMSEIVNADYLKK